MIPSEDPSMMADESEMPSESAVPEGTDESGDFSHGYEICVYVKPNGFQVEGPLPLEAEPSGEGLPTDQAEPHEETDATLPDLATALKHVLAIVKENPVSQDGLDQFNAGYAQA
jgi:hypothetical protein